MLFNEHSIAKGEKPVSLLYRLLVGGQHMLPPRQGRDKHQQSGLRQVEIGDQAVQYLELVAGVDENIRPPAACPQISILDRKSVV